jgi:hypothetical protein
MLDFFTFASRRFGDTGGVVASDRPGLTPMRVLFASLVAITSTTIALAFPLAAELSVVGAWTLNRELTPEPLQDGPPRPPGGGSRRGGFGGGFGGGSVGGRGGMGGANGPNEAEMHTVEVIRRRMTEVPGRLTITRIGDQLTIIDELGRSYTLKADGKKQERVTGDGEFTSKTRFDGARLIVEEDFGGPKLITTYTPLLEGGELGRLEVRLRAENMPGAGRERLEQRSSGGRKGPPEITRIYDAVMR